MSRFSQLYIERGTRVADSERARRRLAAVFADLVQYVYNGRSEIADQIEHRQGCVVPMGYNGPAFDRFFETAEPKDVWDAVTVVAKYMPQNLARRWFAEVASILEEEHLQYCIEGGIVRPFIDAEFEASRAGALDVLGDARFAQARADFEAAFQHLRCGNDKEALWRLFVAVETAAKVLFPGKIARLGAKEVDDLLKPWLTAKYAGNEPAINAGSRLLVGFKEWINAAQQYRHGQEQQDVAEPPSDFVVAHISTGAAYLRWMIELGHPRAKGGSV